MVGPVFVRFFISNEMKVWHTCYTRGKPPLSLLTFASELMDELAFPVEHDVSLMLNSFFLKANQ
jgi:hypothetical protein